jgi:hypothetical protein
MDTVATVMVAGVILHTDGVILHTDGVILRMAGVILRMDGVIPITDMDRTGQVIIVDTMMVIMAEADTIIPPLITPILKVDGATGTVTGSPGQVIQDMVPGA